MICTAELEPGAVISEAELCEQLGVGRTPVREAVRALAAELRRQIRSSKRVVGIRIGHIVRPVCTGIAILRNAELMSLS